MLGRNAIARTIDHLNALMAASTDGPTTARCPQRKKALKELHALRGSGRHHAYRMMASVQMLQQLRIDPTVSAGTIAMFGSEMVRRVKLDANPPIDVPERVRERGQTLKPFMPLLRPMKIEQRERHADLHAEREVALCP